MNNFDFKNALAHLKKDKVLSALIQNHPLSEREYHDDVYEGLIGSILSQQLSVKAAATIKKRFYASFPDNYPDAEIILQREIPELRSFGLSNQKSGYVRNVAQFFIDNNLLDSVWHELEDEEIIKLLTQIKGVGKWTVQMILMFRLSRPDIFPIDDLGIQNAMKANYNLDLEKKALKIEMESIAKSWSPFRTIASLYLWESLNNT